MRRISFDRKILIEEYQDVQIHGFCDASNIGYGACIYVQSVGKNGKIISKLVCWKSRVAPLKTVTIPRLELCGALLLAQLYAEIAKVITPSNKIIFWCDSTIALHWIKTAPHLMKTYVANRVAAISELAGLAEWRHIRSEDNPADAVSRGQLPFDFIQNRKWQKGPYWLVKNETHWYHGNLQKIEIPELRPNTCLVITLSEPIIFKKYSSFSKLCRIVAYCFRFKKGRKFVGPLVAELRDAEIRIIKLLQQIYFTDDVKKLKDVRSSYTGRLVNLNPFLDSHDILRVGGRLQMSNLTFIQKHPILLPSRHHLTDKIIQEIHEKHFHAGIQTTLHLLRRKYWILDGRNQVRKIIRNCVKCYRFVAKPVEYMMGNLPPTRVREATPFANTGIDYCGPFSIKEKKYRNRTKLKIYVCVFICMTIKAIHLEVVSDLSSDNFLAALRRFVARRGVPEKIYSDNGTNFVGANNELKELYALLNSAEHKESVLKYAAEKQLTWHFIPPAAPHFGGLWESSVKLFKHHLKRVVSDSLFTFEEFNTFTIEIEGVFNSRPIMTLSSDPNDPSALTPAHYLIGKTITSLPEPNLTSVPANKLSVWQHISKVRQDFWARWSLEYLNELQIRIKWCKDGPKIEVGTIVLIKDKNLPCTRWLLGKITALHPGEDGSVRAATVKTSHGDLKRATKSLCPLPLEK